MILSKLAGRQCITPADLIQLLDSGMPVSDFVAATTPLANAQRQHRVRFLGIDHRTRVVDADLFLSSLANQVPMIVAPHPLRLCKGCHTLRYRAYAQIPLRRILSVLTILRLIALACAGALAPLCKWSALDVSALRSASGRASWQSAP